MGSTGQSSQPKRNQGRRKVTIEKIKNETNLQVTFSKRRAGLFKKASELCTLTNANVGLVVFSPGNKAHSFGHPNIKTLSDKFLASKPLKANVDGSDHAQHSSIYENRDIKYLAMLEKQLEVEKQKKKELDQIQTTIALEELNLKQLEVLKEKIVNFGKNLKTRVIEAAKSPVVPYNIGHVGTYGMVQYGMMHHDGDVIPYDEWASEVNAPWPTQH